jgi:WD40 repeat protein
VRTRVLSPLLVVVAACTAVAPPPSAPPPAPPPAPAVPQDNPCQEARAAHARVPALLAAGQLDRTVRVLRRAAERCPAEAPRGRAGLVRALARVGRAAEARAEIEAIEADAHASKEAKDAAAEARVMLAASATAGPSAAEIARLLTEADAVLADGLASSDRSKLERARSLYEQAAAGPAPDGDALHGAGRAERALGDAAAAQAFFDRAVVAFEARAGSDAHVDAAEDGEGLVMSAAWSRGGELLAMAFPGGGRVIDLRTLREHGRLDGADEVAFTGSDGGLLLASQRERVDVIDARTLQKVRALDGPCAPMAASPRTATVACGMLDGNVSVWDVERGRKIRVLGDLGGAAIRMHLADDGKTLAVLTAKALSLWDVERGKRTRTRSARPRSELRDLWPMRDGRSFAVQEESVTAPGVIDRVDRATLAARGRIPEAEAEQERAGGAPPPGVTEPFAWSPDGRLHLDRHATLHDRAGAVVPLAGVHARAVISAGFSGDGKVLGAGYEGGVFRSFDTDSGHVRKTYVQTWSTRALAFRVDRGEYIARVASSPRTGWSADGRVEARAHKQMVVVRNAKDEKVCEGEGGTDEILAVAVSPDGGELVTLSSTEALWWDAAHCTVTAPLPGVAGSSPAAASFSPEGNAVAIAWRGARNELRLVDLATRTDRLVGAAPHDTPRVFFLGGGRSLALANPLQIWDLDGTPPAEHAPPVRGAVLAISPDGKLAVTEDRDDGAIRVASVRTGETLAGVRAIGDTPSAYAFVEGSSPADLRVEVLGDKAREALVCRIGARAHAFELCAERSEVPGLFARALRGDRSWREP